MQTKYVHIHGNNVGTDQLVLNQFDEKYVSSYRDVCNIE